MDADILIDLIENTSSLSAEEKMFLIRNIQNLRKHFVDRFGKDIVIDL